MSDTTANDSDSNRFALDDPDRLPWLETADGYEYDNGASPLKVAAMVLGGLALLAAIVGLIYWAQRSDGSGAAGKGELIAAQEGDYKVKPDVAGGKTFEGEGDSAFAASEGKKTGATIAPPAKSGDTKAAAPAPAKPATSGATPAGAVMVQLGAFGDAAKGRYRMGCVYETLRLPVGYQPQDCRGHGGRWAQGIPPASRYRQRRRGAAIVREAEGGRGKLPDCQITNTCRGREKPWRRKLLRLFLALYAQI